MRRCSLLISMSFLATSSPPLAAPLALPLLFCAARFFNCFFRDSTCLSASLALLRIIPVLELELLAPAALAAASAAACSASSCSSALSALATASAAASSFASLTAAWIALSRSTSIFSSLSLRPESSSLRDLTRGLSSAAATLAAAGGTELPLPLLLAACSSANLPFGVAARLTNASSALRMMTGCLVLSAFFAWSSPADRGSLSSEAKTLPSTSLACRMYRSPQSSFLPAFHSAVPLTIAALVCVVISVKCDLPPTPRGVCTGVGATLAALFCTLANCSYTSMVRWAVCICSVSSSTLSDKTTTSSWAASNSASTFSSSSLLAPPSPSELPPPKVAIVSATSCSASLIRSSASSTFFSAARIVFSSSWIFCINSPTRFSFISSCSCMSLASFSRAALASL